MEKAYRLSIRKVSKDSAEVALEGGAGLTAFYPRKGKFLDIPSRISGPFATVNQMKLDFGSKKFLDVVQALHSTCGLQKIGYVSRSMCTGEGCSGRDGTLRVS
jgi:hypothetical protein